jgi:hypothetical protein
MSKYELFDPKNETFEEFISRNLDSETSFCGRDKFTPEALKGLVNTEFDNILYCRSSKTLKGTKGKGFPKGYEIQIKPNLNGYYEFTTTPIPRKIDIRFGCELETCFILNCRKNERQEIEDILGHENIRSIDEGERWQKLIYYHLRNNIIPYLTEEFTSLFLFAYIYPSYHNYGSSKPFFIDMRNGNIINKISKEEEYRTLIFEPDGSIRCDRTQIKNETGDYDSIPISCEIVTPILSSTNDLKILYEGLLPKHNDTPCNQSNSSMGFHVNVSAVDEKGQIVKLTKGMFAELIYDWIPYENKNYKSLRGQGSNYAQKIQDYINDEENIKIYGTLIRSINDEELKVSNFYESYGLAIWYATNLINNFKKLSMTHHKQNNVIEFRVFSSSTDINKLISYTQDAIDIFKGAINKYISNPEETLVQIQKRNLKYKYIQLSIPFKKFEGSFDNFKNYINIRNDYRIKFISYEVSKLFGLRKEKVYSSINLNIFDRLNRLNNNFNNIKIYTETSSGSYYVYDLNIKNFRYEEIRIYNPIKITKEEYAIMLNEYKTSFEDWHLYDY